MGADHVIGVFWWYIGYIAIASEAVVGGAVSDDATDVGVMLCQYSVTDGSVTSFLPAISTPRRSFLARDVIYTSRAYATMSVSVCDGSALAHYS